MTPTPRDQKEIQRAHDILRQIIMDKNLHAIFSPEIFATIFLSCNVLCWMLGHDHNQHFAVLYRDVKNELEARGIYVFELPEMQYPAKTEGQPQ